MKLVVYISVLIIFLVLAISLFVGLTSASSTAPRFKQAQAPVSLTDVAYDFLNPRPFEAGKMWVYGPSGGTNNKQVFIYDIENRRVFGEVTNCWPAMLFGEPPKLLCYQPRPIPSQNVWKQRLLNFLVRISGGRIKLPPAMPGQTYWLLDLKNSAAKRLGDGHPAGIGRSNDQQLLQHPEILRRLHYLRS